MTELVLEHLKKDVDKGAKYVIALNKIEKELKQQGQYLFIETLLSNIEDKIRIIGSGMLNNLTKMEFETIREKIRERILSALQTNTTAHVFAMNYDIVWKKDEHGKDEATSLFNIDCIIGKLASKNRKISVLATRAAIIGGQYGEWKIRPDIAPDAPLSPASYFKEDIVYDVNPETGEPTENQIKTCKGELLLPNFISFVELLKSMIQKNDWEGNTFE